MNITKQYVVDDLEIDEASREVVAVISTDCVDRDGEVVLPRGLSKQNYGGNPVVLWGHNYDLPPIGVTRWVKPDGVKADKSRLIAKYYLSDKTQLARDVFSLLQEGCLRAHSIGFQVTKCSPPTKAEVGIRPDWETCKNVIRSWELLEFSVVSVPANPEALALAVAKGYHPDTLKCLGFNNSEMNDAIEIKQIEIEQIEEVVELIALVDRIEPKFARVIDLDAYLADRVGKLESEILRKLRGKL
jgi:HK97 family phage prohead protease